MQLIATNTYEVVCYSDVAKETGLIQGRLHVYLDRLHMLILSQAGVDNVSPEGAETTRVSSNNNLSHERPALSLDLDDDIVRYSEETRRVLDKELVHNIQCS